MEYSLTSFFFFLTSRGPRFACLAGEQGSFETWEEAQKRGVKKESTVYIKRTLLKSHPVTYQVTVYGVQGRLASLLANRSSPRKE
eukprot:474758-Prorocentrum_minimum.AAC.1